MKKVKVLSILMSLLAMGLAGCGNGETKYESDASGHWTVTNNGSKGATEKHTLVEDTAKSKAATCTEKGEKVEKCSVCGYEKKTSINKIAHTYVEDTAASKAATCTAEGKKVEKCSVCNDVKETPISKLAHTYVEDKTAYIAPTCSEVGKKVEKCSVCNDVKETPIDTIAHTYTTIDFQAATCAAEGTKTEKCSVCQQEAISTIPKLPHTLGEGTAKTDDKGREYTDYECSVCHATVSSRIAFNTFTVTAGEFKDGKISQSPVGEIAWNVQLPAGEYKVYFEAKFSASSGANRTFETRKVNLNYNVEDVEYDKSVTAEDLGMTSTEFNAFTFCTITATGDVDTMKLQNPNYRLVFDTDGYIVFKPVVNAA